MGALYLKPLDEAMAGTGLFYATFMDDWVVLAPSRWKLRLAVRRVNGTLAALQVEHPGKMFTGRINWGSTSWGAASSLPGWRRASPQSTAVRSSSYDATGG